MGCDVEPTIRICIGVALFCSLLCLRAEEPLSTIPLPAQVAASSAFPAPRLTPASICFTLPFEQLPERAYWDFPWRVSETATTLKLVFETGDPIVLDGLTVHLRKGDVWGTAQPRVYPYAEGKYVALCSKGDFCEPDNQPFSWEAANTLRLSFWRQGLKDRKAVNWVQAAFCSDPVALLLPDEAMAAHNLFLARQCAERLQITLFRMGLGTSMISPAALTPSALMRYSALLIPYAPYMTAIQLKTLKEYVKEGGKVLVFYPSVQEFAALLQVQPLKYRAASGGASWSEMVVEQTGLRVPAPTENLLPAQPFSATGEVFAYWRDNCGTVDKSLPAIVLTPTGAWFSHLPPLPSVAAVNLFEGLFKKLLPGLTTTGRTFGTPSPVTILPNAPSRKGVWFHHPESRHEAGWEGVLGELAKVGVTDVFVQLQAAGTVFFPLKGRSVITGRVPRREADGLPALLRAAEKYKLRVHAWVTCWSLEGCDPAQHAMLKAAQRVMADKEGTPLNWLCPSLEENRALLLDGIKALAFRGVHGVHLDYVRYPEGQGCYAGSTRKAFEKREGRRVAAWPLEVLPGGRDHLAFEQFRQQEITLFVQEVRVTLQKSNPACLLSAAVFPTPETARLRAQDWCRWVNESVVDFVCPMMYSNTGYGFEQLLKSGLSEVKEHTRVWPGIGYSAEESQLDRRGVAQQIEKTRQYQVGGLLFFAYDSGLLEVLKPE